LSLPKFRAFIARHGWFIWLVAIVSHVGGLSSF
jgi:hypothetical protein